MASRQPPSHRPVALPSARSAFSALVLPIGHTVAKRVPRGGDVYVLKHVLHDWSDEHATDILRRCRGAMGPEARLLLVDGVIPAGNIPSAVKFSDVHMLVTNAGGRHRTAQEWRQVCEASGFALRTLPDDGALQSLQTLMEGVPI